MPTDTSPKDLATSTDRPADNRPKADNQADTGADKKFDRFHPEMPNIPGVSDAPASTVGSSTQRLARIGGIIAAMLLFAAGMLWSINRTLRAPVESRSAESVGADPSVADVPPLPSVTQTQEGLTTAATVEELSKPWSSKKFTFVTPVTHESVDAIVIRLPGGGLWSFALHEPYGQCELEFVTDLGQIEQQYGYRAKHPMAVNPCNRTVYDPLKVGPLGGSTWARGEVVQGAGLRPPISIDLQVRGHSIMADGIE